MRLFRISHTDAISPYEIEIVGLNLQCLMEVFVQDDIGMKATNRQPFTECVREGIFTDSDGT